MGERDTTGVLFVCLGNICRSPLAQGVFLHRARARGAHHRFVVDSCGTGHWHVGKRPDPRSIEVAARRGVELPGRARQLDPERDFDAFDLIIPMDGENLRDLLDAGAPRDRTRLLRSFDPALAGRPTSELDVPDPYYGAGDGFERVYAMVDAACAGLLDDLLRR